MNGFKTLLFKELKELVIKFKVVSVLSDYRTVQEILNSVVVIVNQIKSILIFIRSGFPLLKHFSKQFLLSVESRNQLFYV